jgi:hypothetical protein
MPFFHAADPGDACPAWDELVQKKGTCTKAGEESINGRPAVKYKGIARNGEMGWAWVDRKLDVVIKWEGPSSASELRNIQEGQQSASLFQVPTDYEKTTQQTNRQASQRKEPQRSLPAPQKP